jgi:hypothetical protein
MVYFSVQLLQSSKRGPCHQVRILTTLRLPATYNENMKYEKPYPLAPREFVLKSDSHFASHVAEWKGLECPIAHDNVFNEERPALAVDLVADQIVLVCPVSVVRNDSEFSP